MPELRQNPATKEWVVIATERARRPEEFSAPVNVSTHNEIFTCPFCPGNEKLSPSELLSYRTYGTQPNTPGWWIRIIPNKFPALIPEGGVERIREDDYYLHMNGLGEHEVLIESPDHLQTIATMEQKQVEEIFLAYRERYITLTKDPRFEMVIVFRNHGIQAGTSIHHPHSQIISTPITPMHIRHRIEESMRYFDDFGHCVYCKMIEKEIKNAERVVMETKNFIAFEPFAARSPFETWVLPKKHDSNYDRIEQELCRELAFMMRSLLSKIYLSLNNPDYNYMIFSSPSHERDLEYYHWNIQIVPRISAVAGFELGSGIYINTMIPEIAARFLREQKAA